MLENNAFFKGNVTLFSEIIFKVNRADVGIMCVLLYVLHKDRDPPTCSMKHLSTTVSLYLVPGPPQRQRSSNMLYEASVHNSQFACFISSLPCQSPPPPHIHTHRSTSTHSHAHTESRTHTRCDREDQGSGFCSICCRVFM